MQLVVMNKFRYLVCLCTLLLLNTYTALSQSKTWCYTGIVLDSENKNPIPNAYIATSDFSTITTSDANGHFELCKLQADSVAITISHTAFVSQNLIITKQQNLTHIYLDIKEYSTAEVTVTSQQNSLAGSYIPGKLTLKNEDILSTPTLLGSPDVVKSLQLMPGIQAANEGNSGIYVRGGSPGQNYVIFDEIELINPSHIMGIFSVFNPLLTNSVDFYKGNAPIHQSNRLASTIIVHSLQQKTTKYNWAGNIGNISSNITYNGKSKNNKWFFSTGLRRSYIEVLQLGANAILEENYFKNNNYFFYDFNGKIQYHSDKNQWQLTWYKGQDAFNVYNSQKSYTGESDWGNTGAALIWKQRINSQSRIKNSIDYTTYHSFFETVFDKQNMYFKTEQEQWRYQLDYSLSKNKHFIHSGVRAIYANFIPQDIKANLQESEITLMQRYKSLSSQVYVSDLYTINDKWQAYGGIRYIYYGLIDNQQHQLLKQKSAHLNSTFTLSYYTSTTSSIKASYAYNTQDIHLASIASIPLPTDVWMPATRKLPHEESQQITLGYFRSFRQSSYEFGIEAYAKTISNELLLNPNFEEEFTNQFEDNFFIGQSKAFGTEILLRKKTGKTTASVSYTYSKTQQQFPDINNGLWFNAKYDRTHDLNIVMTHKPNERMDYGLVFTYATGNNATIPTGRYFIMGNIANDYKGINNYRMPPYHRLDFSVNYYLKSKLFFESVINFSIINVYNHANPYFIYFELTEGKQQYDMSIKAKQSSLFPILPSLSWRFKF